MSIAKQMHEIGDAARKAARTIAFADTEKKSSALRKAASSIRTHKDAILSANRADMDDARKAGLGEAMLDRLMLNESRIEAMAAGVEQVAALPDPVGRVLESWDVEKNGLHIEKIAVPLGVIGIIYEARPNVTADTAALCIKSGNAAILRCGSESLRSSLTITEALHEGLTAAGLPKEAVQLVPTADREAVGILMGMVEHIDILVPRGGKSLTERVLKESRIPTIQHLEGNCHTYIHAAADLKTAVAITHNAKLRRTGICGATESLLIDADGAPSHGMAIIKDLLDGGCEVRGDAQIQKLDARIKPASESDWGTEYLAPIVSAKVVSGLDEALAHIARYGSHHTDAIITEDKAAAARFTREVDSAIVLVNASTQFADGGEFGFGGEIGISTSRLHARGPVGAAQLVTYKYVITTKKPGGAMRTG